MEQIVRQFLETSCPENHHVRNRILFSDLTVIRIDIRLSPDLTFVYPKFLSNFSSYVTATTNKTNLYRESISRVRARNCGCPARENGRGSERRIYRNRLIAVYPSGIPFMAAPASDLHEHSTLTGNRRFDLC